MRQRGIILFLLVLLFGFASAYDWPTLQFLNFWPSARATGLAGCFTSIADDAYTAYYNPAGLPFLQKRMTALTYNPYLTGYYPDMHYLNISYSSPLKNNQGFGVFVPYFTNGCIEVYDENGNYLGEKCNYTFAIAGSYGNQIRKTLSLGGTAKFIYYHGYYWEDWFGMFPPSAFVIPAGSGVGLAVDVGLLYKPISKFNLGFTIQNFGTKIDTSPYLWGYEDEFLSLPRLSRLGIKYGPLTKNKTKTLITAELTKNLVGMFYDPYNTQTFFQELKYELKDIDRGIGLEFSAYDLVHLRIGYYEDVTNRTGGLLIAYYGRQEHVSICDYLFNGEIRGSKIYKVGLTYSVGITYKNASVDIGTDQYLYDFDTANWKFTLSYQF
jgi:hypothetical protein